MLRAWPCLVLVLLAGQDPKPRADPPSYAESMASLERAEREIRDLAAAVRTEFRGNPDFEIPFNEFEARIRGALNANDLSRTMLQEDLAEWRGRRKEPDQAALEEFNRAAAQPVRFSAESILQLHLLAAALRIALLRHRGDLVGFDVSRNDGLENQALRERYPVREEFEAAMKEVEARRRIRLKEAERAFFVSSLEAYRRLKAGLISDRVRLVTEIWRLQEKYSMDDKTDWTKLLESSLDPVGPRRGFQWEVFENNSEMRYLFREFAPPADPGPDVRKVDAELILRMDLASWVPAKDLRPKLPPARLRFEVKAGDRFAPVLEGDVLPMGVDLVVVAEFDKAPVPDRVAVAVDSGSGRMSVDVLRTADVPVRFRSAPFRLKGAP